MSFQIDPKWNDEELFLHRERWLLQKAMDSLYDKDIKTYFILAKRYHEINEILDDNDKC